MASLDLSAAFDVVNVKLLPKRMKSIVVPNDVTQLIENWLSERYFLRVSMATIHSFTTQGLPLSGSILGPIFYAIFVYPLFDLVKLTLCAKTTL